jgi:hypothetical protein
MDEKQAIRSMKSVAFFAIVLSTVAVTTCLVTFPLIFHYVQTLESHVQLELDFCKSRARDMWKEMLEIQVGADRPTTARVANAAVMNEDTKIFLENRERSKRQAGGGCCTCQRGAPGAAGASGVDGSVRSR